MARTAFTQQIPVSVLVNSSGTLSCFSFLDIVFACERAQPGEKSALSIYGFCLSEGKPGLLGMHTMFYCLLTNSFACRINGVQGLSMA